MAFGGVQQSILQNKVKVIFSEPQFSTKPLEPVVKDLGIVLSILDPIGLRGMPYLGHLLHY